MPINTAIPSGFCRNMAKSPTSNTPLIQSEHRVLTDCRVLGVVGITLGYKTTLSVSVSLHINNTVRYGDIAVHKRDNVAGLQLVRIGLNRKNQVAYFNMILGTAAHGAGLHDHRRYS